MRQPKQRSESYQWIRMKTYWAITMILLLLGVWKVIELLRSLLAHAL